jgi:hypothetical protein
VIRLLEQLGTSASDSEEEEEVEGFQWEHWQLLKGVSNELVEKIARMRAYILSPELLTEL